MNALTTVLNAAFDKFEENYSKRFNDHIEANYKGVTVDVNGRLHAPYDGYQVNAKSYHKGEFIDMETNDDIFSEKGTFKGKVKINVDDFDTIATIIDSRSYGEASKGKSWNENGVEVCYIYLIVTFKSVISIIEKVVKNTIEEKEPVFVEDGKQTIVVKLVKIETNYFHNKYYTSSQNVATFVTEDGAIVKGTLPKSVEDAEEGSIIEFTATFTKKQFCSIYKRPSKAKIIS